MLWKLPILIGISFFTRLDEWLIYFIKYAIYLLRLCWYLGYTMGRELARLC